MANEIQTILSIASGERNVSLIYALKLERVESHLKFLRECRRRRLLPKGFLVKNKVKDTLENFRYFGEKLALKHARQWLQLTLDGLYLKRDWLSLIPIYPMTSSEFNTLKRYKYLLRTIKRKKIHNLLRPTANTNEAPLGFVNKSSATFITSELELLNKGPAFIPPLPRNLLTNNITFKAEVQACFDRVQKKSSEIGRSSEFIEFLSGLNRITTKASKEQSASEKLTLTQIKEIL
jgi:hypothetical protein